MMGFTLYWRPWHAGVYILLEALAYCCSQYTGGPVMLRLTLYWRFWHAGVHIILQALALDMSDMENSFTMT